MKPTYQFVPALPKDNPSPDVQKYIDGILANSDKTTIQRLIHGNFEFDDDPSALMSYDKIMDIFSNTHVPSGRKVITADIARLGGDKIVVIEWDGWRGKVKAMEKQPLDVTARIIEGSRLSLQCGKSDILVDEDGVGGGIVDFYKCKGFVNNSRPMPNPDNLAQPENFDNLKSQCYFRLAKRVNDSGIFIDCDDPKIKAMIVEELEQVKQKAMDTDQKKGVVPKDRVKEVLGRSPDFADAIMMREWFELKPVFKIAVA